MNRDTKSMYGCDWVKLCGDEMRRRTEKREQGEVVRQGVTCMEGWRRRGAEGEEQTRTNEVSGSGNFLFFLCVLCISNTTNNECHTTTSESTI